MSSTSPSSSMTCTRTLGSASQPQMPLLTVYGGTSLGSRPASPGSGQLATLPHGPTCGALGSAAFDANGLSVTPPLCAAIV